jgi:hypothetical protein
MNGDEGDVERNRTDIYSSVSDYFALSLSWWEGIVNSGKRKASGE